MVPWWFCFLSVEFEDPERKAETTDRTKVPGCVMLFNEEGKNNNEQLDEIEMER